MRVLTMGSFALPHIGHAAFLRACEAFGELTVGVNSDSFIRRYKGSDALFSQHERMELIRSLGYHTVLNDGPGRELIFEVEPRVIAIGSDWASRDYYRQINFAPDDFEKWGITLVYIPIRPAGISSTEVIRRCRA